MPCRDLQLVPRFSVIRPQERWIVVSQGIHDFLWDYALEVRYQLEHVGHSLNVRSPLDLLQLIDSKSHQQVAKNEGDKHNKEHEDEVCGSFVRQLVFECGHVVKLASEHDDRLHEALHGVAKGVELEWLVCL